VILDRFVGDMETTIPLRRMVAWSFALLASCSSEKKASDQTADPPSGPHELVVDSFGVALQVSGDWKIVPRDTNMISLTSGRRFVTLERLTFAVAKLEDARRSLGDAKIYDEQQLASGAYSFVYDLSPAGGGSARLIGVVLPIGEVGVRCLGLPRHEDGPEELAIIQITCASMRALGGTGSASVKGTHLTPRAGAEP